MHTRYRSSLVSLALLALGSLAPPASAAQDATTDPAQQAAEGARRAAVAAVAPMQFADFVGGWSHHGYHLTVYPDGSAVAVWRTYDGDLPEAPGGNATLRFDRVEGRSLYGTVLASTHRVQPTRADLVLTEYEYGVGFLAAQDELAAPGAPYAPLQGTTLCGPRFATAPEWFRGTAPCGA